MHPKKLAKQLAHVAAGTSDAFISTTGKKCKPTAYSQIYISPPSGLGVAQLHIHIQPPIGIFGSMNETEIYAGVSKYLRERFASGLVTKGQHQ